jgi:hypothetical protein
MLIALLTELQVISVEVSGVCVPILGFDRVDLGAELTLEPVLDVYDPVLNSFERLLVVRRVQVMLSELVPNHLDEHLDVLASLSTDLNHGHHPLCVPLSILILDGSLIGGYVKLVAHQVCQQAPPQLRERRGLDGCVG